MSAITRARILTTRECRWTIRVSVALHEKGVPFELVDVAENGGKAPWFLARTPFGKTPVLQCGEHSIPESLVICEYIDELFDGRDLLPRDPLSRAWDRIWLRFCDDTLIKALYEIARAKDGSSRREAAARLLTEGGRVEQYCRRQPASRYWRGSELTLPDLCYFTFFEALDRMEEELRGSFLEACPRLGNWRQALSECAAFAAATKALDALSR